MSIRTVTFVPRPLEAQALIISPKPEFFPVTAGLDGCGGSSDGIGDVRSGAGLWQLSQCVYLPHAARLVRGQSGFGLPPVRRKDPLLRQFARPQLGFSGRAMPPLLGPDYPPLRCG